MKSHPQRSRSATPNSGSNDEARDSADENSGPVKAAAPKEKATAPKEKRKVEEKHPEDAGPSKKKTEKRRKSDEQESMLIKFAAKSAGNDGEV